MACTVSLPKGLQSHRFHAHRLITSISKLHSRNAHQIRCQGHNAVSSSPTTQPGLVFSLGEPGSWDEAGIAYPIVRYYLGDNEQRWFMWYTGRSSSCFDIDDIYPSSGSVGVAVSSDGVNWSRGSGAVEGVRGEGRGADVGKVLSPNGDWWWHDTCHLHVSDVQILANSAVGGTGVYWCFYSGGNFEESEIPQSMLSSVDDEAGQAGTSRRITREGVTLRPGLAMSQDGRNFARIEGDHHTGALFDVGETGEWDHLFIGAPQVVAAGPKDMRMYYHSYDAQKEKYVVGVATSPDGFKWTKKGAMFEGGTGKSTDFDARGAAARCVVRDIDTQKYFMFYEAVAEDDSRSIGLAVSDDGLKNWRRTSEPVLTASSDPGAWDGGAVGTPWAVSMNKGKWRLYFSGRKGAEGGAWGGIGLALSVDGHSTAEGAPVKFKRRSGGGGGQ